MTKIVLITSGQPSTNPRLVKEADALASRGFEVTVIYQYWTKWATVSDLQLLQDKNWKAIRVGGSPTNGYLEYWRSRIIHRLGRFLANYFGYKNGLAEIALNRNTHALINKARRIPATLYIAHNLGALPAAVLASKNNKAKCGFDAEDFHRQEVTDDLNTEAYQLVKFIEDKYLPQVDYLTAASPLIAEAYQQLYKDLMPVVLNNVFSSTYLQAVTTSSPHKELKLFWFSQTIGKGRGLEDAIKAVALLKKTHISLTLLGSIDQVHQHYFSKLANELGLAENQLHFIAPVAPNFIFEIANNCDIGLALEQTIPLNKDLCLANKVFTYLTAGLAVIATDTAAQKQFMSKYSNIGKTYPNGNVVALSTVINYYDEHHDRLDDAKLASHQLAKQELNWEIESKVFLNIIEKTIVN